MYPLVNAWGYQQSKLEVQQLVYDFETFEVLQRGAKPPEGHQRIPLIIVFDNKFDGRRKCRIVGGGHVTAPPAEDVYFSVFQYGIYQICNIPC